MPTAQSSAEAYDKLSVLTDRYVTAQGLSHGWLKIIRACRSQSEALALAGRLDEETSSEINAICERATNQRQKLDIYLMKLQTSMDSLNSQIQNGVYNGEQTA